MQHKMCLGFFSVQNHPFSWEVQQHSKDASRASEILLIQKQFLGCAIGPHGVPFFARLGVCFQLFDGWLLNPLNPALLEVTWWHWVYYSVNQGDKKQNQSRS